MAKRSMVISIIGRPNVGKSSLYNRIMGKREKVLTYDTPGVTRDRHYGLARLDALYSEEPVETIMIDTGGFYPEKVDEESLKSRKEKNLTSFFNIMGEHAQIAIDESDLVLLVVDVREGLNPFDEGIVKMIRESKTPFLLMMNKFDSESMFGQEVDFYSLGVKPDDMFTISAAHRYGLDDFLEELQRRVIAFNKSLDSASHLQKGVTPKEDVVAKLAIIGAPNAGKSTLLNTLLGSERALVSNIPGTTVDPIEGFFEMHFGSAINVLRDDACRSYSDHVLFSEYDEFRKNNPDLTTKIDESYEDQDTIIQNTQMDKYGDDEIDRLENQIFGNQDVEEEEEKESHWRSIHIIDTAGIRRQKKVEGFVESQSVYRSLRCITESDVVIFMIDSTKGIGHQDRRLLDISLDKGKSVIICLNKFDLIQNKYKTKKDRREWLLDLRDTIPWLDYCDVIPLSAKKRTGIKRLKQCLKKTILIRHRKISTGELNRLLLMLVDHHPIVVGQSGGKRLKIKYGSMVKNSPPTFLLFCNRSRGIPENYKRYLKNSIRRAFDLDNTPIHIIFRTGSDLEKRMKKVESALTNKS